MSKAFLICGIAVAFLMICENALSFRRSDIEMTWTFVSKMAYGRRQQRIQPTD